jgi:hypothetical protein
VMTPPLGRILPGRETGRAGAQKKSGMPTIGREQRCFQETQ